MAFDRATLPLSEVDRAIIHALEHDGRRSATAIAQSLGLPLSTVRRRLQRLLDEGALQVVAIPDNDRLGLPVHVLMRIEADTASGDTIGEALEAMEEVRWVAMVAGQFDFLVEAFFPSNLHLHAFLVQKLARIPGILRTETLTVLRLYKNSFDWSSMLEATQADSAITRR
ncbi:MAG TPA: Lrp/AsnC family transcriptional regulator [Nitrolancea sp.]|nr:Lrp/AsnC family transcriptional regulator [Nitrolancea sp.]